MQKQAIHNSCDINNNNLCEIRITVNGEDRYVKPNTKVSDLLVSALPCGGHGKCGKCKVRAYGELSPITEGEKEHLTDEEIKSGIRLGCHTFILGSCTVESITDSSETLVLIEGVKKSFTLDPTFEKLGVAIDIGTTTLAARLLAPSGETLAEAGDSNPQSVFGADVISRIEAALAGSGAALAELIRNKLDELINRLCSESGRNATDIDGIAITGNTVMLYLLTGTSPEPLSHAPFTLSRAFNESLKAETLGLTSVTPDTEVYLPPCISAFIGADTVCAILAADLCQTDRTAMLADIGTNGEMALWHSGKLYACSTAAGPAFEGVGISMGMRGEPGAIDKVTLVNGRMDVSVIGDISPKGICGSGLVDAVAALLNSEELDETGYLEDDEVTLLSPVTLTAKDIRMVQLAKSAINAGLCTLMHEAKTEESDVCSLFIAGGFGNYLNKNSAARIGLLPSTLVDRIETIGNAALIGAEMLLLDRNSRVSAESIASEAITVELSTNKYFSDTFISGMMF